MNADDFRDYMLFLFLRYLSDNYEAAAKKELGKRLSDRDSAILKGFGVSTRWHCGTGDNPDDTIEFEK